MKRIDFIVSYTELIKKIYEWKYNFGKNCLIMFSIQKK
jgi:hypothetical protein